MSETTWRKEFYPIDAGKVPASKAIKHSLVKWYGLRKDSLKKHGLEYPPIRVDADTCALCNHYFYTNDCKGCPLAEYLGRRCDTSAKSEFHAYDENGNPEPMIAALEAIEFVERTCK